MGILAVTKNPSASVACDLERGAVERCAQLEQALRVAHADLARLRSEIGAMRAIATTACHQARHDSLTALPNRRYFLERLGQALGCTEATDRGVAVLYLDLDEFKRINDVHGHAAGDEVLRIVAARLLRAVRAADLVCRLGGDEFALLVEGTQDQAELSRIAAKLFDVVSAPLKVGARVLVVRPSIGIACGPADGRTLQVLLRHADAAMYRAKAGQAGYTFFDGVVDTIAAFSAIEASCGNSPASSGDGPSDHRQGRLQATAAPSPAATATSPTG